MAVSFRKLFAYVQGQSNTFTETKEPSKRERVRQTAADEHQSRKERRAELDEETQAGLSDLKDLAKGEKERHLSELRQKWKSPEELFVAGEKKLVYGADFTSSNPKSPAVYAIWYEPDEGELFVTFFAKGSFQPGPTYKYWTVSPDEARDIYQRASKGEAIWDTFRVRGTKTGHRKHYAQV